MLDRQEALLLSVPDVARRLGIGRDRTYALCHAGVLPSVRVGRRLLVPRQAVDRLVERIMAGEFRDGIPA